MTLTEDQCRGARGLLDWTQAQLAKAAKVGLSTVQDFESGKRRPIQRNLDAIRSAFEKAGIVFIDANGGGPGVRRKG